jgi:hypothetical protein
VDDDVDSSWRSRLPLETQGLPHEDLYVGVTQGVTNDTYGIASQFELETIEEELPVFL